MKEEYNIGSVEKALRILRVFTRERPEMSITEISRELGLTYSTTFRLIATLEVNSFLYKNPGNQKYSLGPAIRILNSNYVEHFAFKEIAMCYLQSIVERLEETAVLYVIKSVKNNLRICIAREESSHTLRPSINVNDELALTRGSSGQVLVANLPQKDQKYLIELETSLSLEKLQKIKKNGYAFNDGGRIEGTAGVAVPVFDHEGKLLAAIGITGASYRFEGKSIIECATFLKECSKNITKTLANEK
ncbi:MAG: IclR family transcriptional regulator [Firmicutes bacterium]|nr:IclR family transcriptional regulator [Bacillota bacterium]